MSSEKAESVTSLVTEAQNSLLTKTRRSSTYTRSGAKIEKNFTLLQKPVFLIQLDQLEGSTGSISFLFGEFVPFIQTAFAVLIDKLAIHSLPDNVCSHF